MPDLIWWVIFGTGALVWGLGGLIFVTEGIWWACDKWLRSTGQLGDLYAAYRRLLKERRGSVDE